MILIVAAAAAAFAAVDENAGDDHVGSCRRH